MIWRAPNNARAMREIEADHVCDLGPIIGQIEPMRPLPNRGYRTSPPWIEDRWQTFIGWCAFGAWAAVIVVWLWLSFVVLARAADAPQPASGASEFRVKIDCTPDALTYCKAAIPHGRDAIVHCMIINKDLLRPRCRRHLW